MPIKITILDQKMNSFDGIVYLIEHNVGDERQALRLVHAGTNELATQQELPVVPLLVLRVDRLPLLCWEERVEEWESVNGRQTLYTA